MMLRLILCILRPVTTKLQRVESKIKWRLRDSERDKFLAGGGLALTDWDIAHFVHRSYITLSARYPLNFAKYFKRTTDISIYKEIDGVTLSICLQDGKISGPPEDVVRFVKKYGLTINGNSRQEYIDTFNELLAFVCRL